MLFSNCFLTFFCCSVYFFRMTNLSQVVDIRQCVYFFDNMEQTLCMVGAGSADQALAVVGVAEHDSVSRTSLLAGSLDVYHVFQHPVFLFGLQLAFLETL